MVARSKVDLLPEDTRRELEQRLIAQAFGDYDSLAEWLAEQGFEISRASVYRWGSRFEERLKAVSVIAAQAKAMRDSTPDDDGAVTEMLLRMSQEKMFQLLLDLEIDPETIDPTKLFRAVAEMSKASTAQKRFQQEVQKRTQAAADAVQATLKAAGVKGLSASTAEEIRAKIMGIAA